MKNIHKLAPLSEIHLIYPTKMTEQERPYLDPHTMENFDTFEESLEAIPFYKIEDIISCVESFIKSLDLRINKHIIDTEFIPQLNSRLNKVFDFKSAENDFNEIQKTMLKKAYYHALHCFGDPNPEETIFLKAA